MRYGDEVAPAGSIVGVHLDNVHKVSPQGLADIFNEFLAAVETARQEGRISKNRKVGYVAKNVPQQVQRGAGGGAARCAAACTRSMRTRGWTKMGS